MSRSRSTEVPRDISLFYEDGETLVVESVDDGVSVSLEPVRVYGFIDGIAVTGLQHVADYLDLHVNTVRRYAEKGFLLSPRYSSGVRRIGVESLKELRAQMYQDIDAEEGADQQIALSV